MKKYLLKKVFTPSSPAELTFVEREDINRKLVDALGTPGKQIVIYGHSGSGKTTLLHNKLKQTYENHIKTPCTIDTSFDQLILDAFDKLDVYFTDAKYTTKNKTVSVGLKSKYVDLKSEMGKKDEEHATRIVPAQLTVEKLANFMGEVGSCWVLEDFHKVNPQVKTRIAQAMKVFMDCAVEYSEVKIIAIGAANSAREVIEYNSEMRGRISEILVPLMSNDELHEIISKGSSLLNINITKNGQNSIVQFSNGLAAVCHQLCFNICGAADIFETSQSIEKINKGHIKLGVEFYIEDASDSLKKVFDLALKIKRSSKYHNSDIIIDALASFDQEGAIVSDIYKQIIKTESNYPRNNLTIYLKNLQNDNRGAVLKYDESSNKYSFSDPVYRTFALTRIASKDEPIETLPENIIFNFAAVKLDSLVKVSWNEVKKKKYKNKNN